MTRYNYNFCRWGRARGNLRTNVRVKARTFAAWIKKNTLLVSGSPGIFPSLAVSLGIMQPPTSCSLPERGARGQRASSLTHCWQWETAAEISTESRENEIFSRCKSSADALQTARTQRWLCKKTQQNTLPNLRAPEPSHISELHGTTYAPCSSSTSCQLHNLSFSGVLLRTTPYFVYYWRT